MNEDTSSILHTADLKLQWQHSLIKDITEVIQTQNFAIHQYIYRKIYSNLNAEFWLPKHKA